MIRKGIRMRSTHRLALACALFVAAFAAAPLASARSHWNVGINLGFPGVSLGYSDCRHCGSWGVGYAAPAYYGGYYGGYGRSWYRPVRRAYVASWYAPPVAYYPPLRRVTYHRVTRYSHRDGRYDDRYGYDRDYDRGRDGRARATYYDRGD
jgi:hypothetical protein